MISQIALTAALVTTFNLNCGGNITSDSYYGGHKVEPYSYVYRMDLTKRKWCEGECKALFDFADIQPTQLRLQDKTVDTPSERSSVVNTIDRETGKHSTLSIWKNPRDRADSMMLSWEGRCERQSFSGFPTFETKF